MAEQGAAENGSANRCDGKQLGALYRAAATWLGKHTERIDALNVFPVPDGDTGTNMRLTMDAALQALESAPTGGVGPLAASVARAALIGARGNSGVILSQILGGLAAGLAGLETFGPLDLARAWQEAEQHAYRAVTTPVEGTMLTVVKDVAAAVGAAASRQAPLPTILRIAAETARATTQRTPEMLAALREAGVVDAGAEGLAILLDGMRRFAAGQSLEVAVEQPLVRPNAAVVTEAAHVLDEHGYCTNFMVRGTAPEVEQLRAELLTLGTSAVVAGSGGLLKVHLHTDHPGAALEAGGRLGELTAIEIVNMRDQVAALQQAHPTPLAPAVRRNEEAREVALVAIVPSAELIELFRGFEAQAILGGQTMNPSVGAIRDAIEQSDAKHVLVLPNNSNVVLTAREAARLSRLPATVIPTTSVPEGVAAAVAFLADRDLTENVEAMQAAAATVTTIEVTTASRACSLDGRPVAEGSAIALTNGELSAADETPEAAALVALARARGAEHSLVTLYPGQGVSERQLSVLQAKVKEQLPGLGVEVVVGGQPFYPYLIALE